MNGFIKETLGRRMLELSLNIKGAKAEIDGCKATIRQKKIKIACWAKEKIEILAIKETLK